MSWIDKIGGRKYTMTMGCGLVTAGLQWGGKLDPAGLAYVAVITATVGAYIAGNVLQKKHEGAEEAKP